MTMEIEKPHREISTYFISCLIKTSEFSISGLPFLGLVQLNSNLVFSPTYMYVAHKKNGADFTGPSPFHKLKTCLRVFVIRNYERQQGIETMPGEIGF